MDLPLAMAQRIEWLGGYCTLADVVACGGSAQDMVRWQRAGILHRLRRGAYVVADRFTSADPTEQRWLWASATTRARTLAVPLVASAETALWVWRVPTLHTELSNLVLARVSNGAAATRRGEQIQKSWGAAHTTCGHTPVVMPAIAAVGYAARAGVESGVVAMDAVLHTGLASVEELRRVTQENAGRAGVAAARRATELADARSESPGESLLRLALSGLGLRCDPQAWIDTDIGRFRVDFAIPELGAVAEFDGAVKYEGLDGKQALVAEKRREDAIRRAGFRVIRVTWRDLREPGRLAHLFDRAPIRRSRFDAQL